MATWKKVIVSGSNAVLNQVTASGGINATLPAVSQPNIVAYDSASGTFSYAGTGSFTAATASYITASNVYGPYGSNSILSASFAVTAAYASNVPVTASYALQALSASYAISSSVSAFATTASFANTAGQTVASLTQGTGVTSFTFNGTSSATVAVSGASTLNSNRITKWDGVAFSNSSLTDNGTTITGTTSIQLTGASSLLTGSFTGSFTGDGSGLTGLATTLAVTGSNGTSGSVNLLTQGLTITGTANEVETSVSGQTVTIGLPNDVTLGGDLTLGGNDIKASDGNTNITLTSNTLTTFAGDIKVMGNDIQSSGGNSVFTLSGTNATANGNLTVQGDLTVAGTASFNNQTSLLIADRFILLASGSSTLTDGGIIVNSGATTGSAWYLESTSTGTYGRWAVSGNADASASTLTADEFGVTAKQASGAPAADPTWGGSTNGFGNIYVDSGTGDIYIYS
jgi:hypothetical protein